VGFQQTAEEYYKNRVNEIITSVVQALKDDTKRKFSQTEIYFLAHECLRRANVVVPVFGSEFIESLDTVEVLDEEKN
jgi:hypothetical protein